ncbi:glycosyltransferase family 4 protein [Cytobacillus pseudoceanisediminis]|uniref:Glycosyl transferase n=2 Tax=Cytobacillus TaxID=2675230 RepID=A0ABX3CWS8_9BACI|nr:glycosyltransferase family 4 protein [Cytobacillus oceanisediminis]OHX49904.1 glycosyl transferase [Cytobacillus oceanisediminis]
MKVCHITTVHPYKDIRIFIKEAKSLQKNGYEMHLIAPNAPSAIIDGIQVHGINLNRGDRQNRLGRMIKTTNLAYKKAMEINADLYHFHDPELIPAGLKLKRQQKKVIYDVHEDVPRQILQKNWIPRLLRTAISSVFEEYEKRAVKKMDYVVAATPFIKNRFTSIGCNSIDICNYPVLSEFDHRHSEEEVKENAVCYIGAISEIRGIFEMVDSMSLVPDVHLFLAGKFASDAERELVKQKSGWKKVSELGYLDREEIRNVLSKSLAGLVVLHPTINYKDALPIKLFEYMAAGIPVIASDFPLWKEIVEKSDCGICVDPLNPKEIADAIQFYIENPEEAKRMGENGRRAVEQIYNWDLESKKLVSVYQTLLPENRFVRNKGEVFG